MTNPLAEFSKKLDEKLIPPLRQVLKGRKYVYVTPPQGFGITSVDWGKITEMSGGLVSYSFTSGNKDRVDASLTNTKIPVYWKDYEIDAREYYGWMEKNIDIDATNAIAAGYQAALVEDTALINGVSNDGTNYDHKGMYQGAGNDYNVATTLGTFGNFSDALAGAFEMMDEDHVPVDSIKWNCLINSTAYHTIRKTRSTLGLKEMPDIVDYLNGGELVSVGTILSTAQAVLVPDPSVGEPYLDYYLTADFQTDPMNPEFQKTGNIGGRVFSAGALRIKQDVALCKISNLTYPSSGT